MCWAVRVYAFFVNVAYFQGIKAEVGGEGEL